MTGAAVVLPLPVHNDIQVAQHTAEGCSCQDEGAPTGEMCGDIFGVIFMTQISYQLGSITCSA